MSDDVSRADERTRRSELLAVADGDELVALADRCIAAAGEPTLLAGPEVGSIVLTVREPVEATRLHLGDVLVTRSEVEHRRVRGWAMRMGDDRASALAAAICDAELEAGGPEAGAVADLCRRTADRLRAERAEEWAALRPTIVEFEEMEA